MVYVPPFVITPTLLNLVSDIQRCLGEISGIKLDYVPIKLRKENNIKTIQASLAIEGNTLNIHQITTLLEGKRVIAPEKDIKEVKNALIVYENIGQYNPLQKSHLLKVHKDLMNDLVASPGQWRTGSVGIFKGHHISHLPPPAHQVDFLMNQLFQIL